MMRVLATLFAALLLTLGGYMFYVWAFSSWTWRQKLTVGVETPAGPVSGSGVVGVYWKFEPFVPGHPGGLAGSGMRGEATVVDLGDGKYVFALIGGAETLAQHVLLDKALLNTDMAVRAGALQRVGLSGEVASTLSPLLVTFADIADPKSVRRVDPDDLDAAFGLCPDGKGLKDADAPWRAEGLTWRRFARWQASGLSLAEFKKKYESYTRPDWLAALDAKVTPRDRSADCRRLKAITLEIVDEAVTEGKVESVLGWLEAVGRERANLLGKPPTGLVSEQPDPRMYLVSPLDFSTELYK